MKNLHGNLDCQSSPENKNNITIQTHIDRENLKPEEREFQINGFKNPEEPKFEQSFQIMTFDADGFLIDEIDDGLSIT